MQTDLMDNIPENKYGYCVDSLLNNRLIHYAFEDEKYPYS